jgi:ABC-type uncharacterized transport system permease subunit
MNGLDSNTALFAVLLGLSYATLSVLAWRRSVSREQDAVLLVVAVAHTGLLYLSLWQGKDGIHLGYAQALSLVSCVGVWLLMVESRWVALDALRPLALSLPAIAVVLGACLPTTAVLRLDALGAVHVLVGIVAHGVALLAAGHGVLLLALSRVLKNGNVSAWAQTLSQHCPPLVVLERLLIRLSLWVAGLLALTVGLGMAGGHLKFDHKTVLTVVSLFAWLAVPWGYQRRAWRGAQLCWAAVFATGLLLLAYIGSRFVLQAILQR